MRALPISSTANAAASDVHAVRAVSAVLLVGVLVALAAPGAEAGWTRPKLTAPFRTGAVDRIGYHTLRVELNRRDDAALAFAADDYVFAVVRPAGKGFGKPVKLGVNAIGVGPPALAVDRLGGVTVAWTQRAEAEYAYQVVAAHRPPGGSFGPPRPLSSTAGDTLGASPQLAVTEANQVVAAWHRTRADGTNAVETATLPPGGEFGPARTVATEQSPIWRVHLVHSGRDVMWSRGRVGACEPPSFLRRADATGPRTRFPHSFDYSARNWHGGMAAVTFDEDCDDDGDPFTFSDRLRLHTIPRHGVSRTQVFKHVRFRHSNSVAIADDGRAVVTWQRGADARPVVTDRPPGGKFSRPRLIHPSCEQLDGWPDVALDRHGNAAALAAEDYWGGQLLGYARVRGQREFGRPERLPGALARDSRIVGQPVIVFDHHGNALGAWHVSKTGIATTWLHPDGLRRLSERRRGCG
jgi:hypothetical protein